MHFAFSVVWFAIWFSSSFFTSFAGASVTLFLLAAFTWLVVCGIVVWRWWAGSRWYGLLPVGWLAVFLIAYEIQSGSRPDCWPLCG